MSRTKQNRATLNALLEAIVRDDIRAAKKFFQADATLAAAQIDRDKLFQAGIFHWLYVGDTALHLAAAGYRTEIVGLLLGAGADPNAANNRRKSGPLHYAADGYITGPAWDEKRQLKTIGRLLAAGAAIDAQDNNGATPLHRAVRTRCAAAVRLLLESGADPTLKNKPGSTPFHLAVQNTGRGGSGAPEAIAAQRQIIEMFVSRGISAETKSAGGKTVREATQSAWIRELIG